MKAARDFRVSSTAVNRDFARYSDRYADAPVESFHKSRVRTIVEGVHFPSELLPPRKGDAARKRAGAAAGTAAANGSAKAAGKGKRPAVGDAIAKRLRTLEDGDEDDEGQIGKPKRARSNRTILESDEDDDEEEEGEGKKGDAKKGEEKGGEEGDDLDGLEEEEEEDDILGDDDQYDFGDGFEDGMDDIDSGGEDEPTY